ncbi:preprotein translocase subunit SecY [Euhalothece natronophila Z-M001]|uniref:Protein translocase subunit SecY n=1 Tax=Euhalothece natronophila Z-M001 TaxID=522448 RepID=A0A5B8NM57_9CHRO|nr:preprotein translocase subunit SecY [Euhalothece natronophila]QDZ40124.1 preprotein translocase subunit SecY [Euhalothece natronophila Z-M001]
MVVSRERTPNAQETFMQMAQAAGLRGRLLLTVGLILLVRLGVRIPVPGVDRAAFAQAVQDSPISGFLNFLSGGGLSAVGIFALGILPFINASIIMQLLTAGLPYLENLQKNEGEAGRRKISQITRYVALASAIFNAIGLASFVQPYAYDPGPIFVIKTVIALSAGSMFVIWLAELITERGIGNGPSLLIFVNIVAVLPRTLGNTIEFAQAGGREAVAQVVVLALVFLVMIVGIVFVQEGMRKIPIVSARRQVGKRLYRERTSYLPLRVNQGGVLPIIFASTLLILPSSLAQFTQGGGGDPEQQTGGVMGTLNEILIQISTYLNPAGPAPWIYISVYLALILFFSYFYAALVVNPVDMSQNLKKMGASIPGIRPGKATSDYLQKVINRLTLLGAIFLGIVATVPTAVETATGVTTFQGLGATSLLILVGVAIDTAKQIQSRVISQRYEGMVKE